MTSLKINKDYRQEGKTSVSFEPCFGESFSYWCDSRIKRRSIQVYGFKTGYPTLVFTVPLRRPSEGFLVVYTGQNEERRKTNLVSTMVEPGLSVPVRTEFCGIVECLKMCPLHLKIDTVALQPRRQWISFVRLYYWNSFLNWRFQYS